MEVDDVIIPKMKEYEERMYMKCAIQIQTQPHYQYQWKVVNRLQIGIANRHNERAS